MAQTLYEILGIPEHAATDAIHSSYKQVEAALEGDAGPESAETLRIAREAFIILADPARRIAYDRNLAAKRIGALAPHHGQSPRWPIHPAYLVAVAAILGLMLFEEIHSRHLEQNAAQEVARARSVAQDAEAKAAELNSKLESLLTMQRELAQRQADQESRRMEAQFQTVRQWAEASQQTAALQIEAQTRISGRELALQEAAEARAADREELSRQAQELDLQYRKPARDLELKFRQEQSNETTKQLALDQHDRNLQSIRELHALRQEVDLSQKVHAQLDSSLARSNPSLDH